MVLSQNFRVAFRALLANKMRSILTMLGIVIGVGAVVALMSIGNGAKNSITGEVQGAGSNLVTIAPGNLAMGMRGVSTAHLYYKDVEMLQTQFANTAKVSPAVQSNYPVKYGNITYSYGVTGITKAYFEIGTIDLSAGRKINQSDESSQALVAVIGSTVATDLFGGVNPVGKTIKINGVRFQVVGSLYRKAPQDL